MPIQLIHDLPDPDNPGKTYKESNLEKQHKYQVGNLVEIIGWEDDCEYDGIRLYVIGCVRDCDGTPLYVLGTKGMELYQRAFVKKYGTFYNFKSISGIGEQSLKLIKS